MSQWEIEEDPTAARADSQDADPTGAPTADAAAAPVPVIGLAVDELDRIVAVHVAEDWQQQVGDATGLAVAVLVALADEQAAQAEAGAGIAIRQLDRAERADYLMQLWSLQQETGRQLEELGAAEPQLVRSANERVQAQVSAGAIVSLGIDQDWAAHASPRDLGAVLVEVIQLAARTQSPMPGLAHLRRIRHEFN
ncbi:hypothetical protein [Parenemella sanctibonifatiensis]|uniref:Uncharacterized protein n=1 Tax=Parenemella sanctibonifatiensis TaxID=2016505 RepID=A0A255EKQ2_9ACTN|nr:hypothetical protein [Parenemella sanctibonifatiensis]OYN92064.1 hypothetical protein CGZ91_00650 [Parenemella sanctibonifatiensis]